MDNIALKVSGTSNPLSVAAAITGYLLSGQKVCINVMGIGASYTCIKAMIKARGMMAEHGVNPLYYPHYTDEKTSEGVEKTVITWEVVML